MIKISRNQGNVPGFCKCLVDSWYGSLLGITSPRAGQTSAHEMEDANQKSEIAECHLAVENDLYWPKLGTLIDRTAFVVYLIMFVVMMSKHLF